MDEYKELFYSRINHKLGNYGDVSARKELRHGLECRLVCRAETEKYIFATISPAPLAGLPHMLI